MRARVKRTLLPTKYDQFRHLSSKLSEHLWRWPCADNIQRGPCACTVDGKSGAVATGVAGCGQWNISRGNKDYWCYVVHPANCSAARVSASGSSGKGAGWVPCGPNA